MSEENIKQPEKKASQPKDAQPKPSPPPDPAPQTGASEVKNAAKPAPQKALASEPVVPSSPPPAPPAPKSVPSARDTEPKIIEKEKTTPPPAPDTIAKKILKEAKPAAETIPKTKTKEAEVSPKFTDPEKPDSAIVKDSNRETTEPETKVEEIKESINSQKPGTVKPKSPESTPPPLETRSKLNQPKPTLKIVEKEVTEKQPEATKDIPPPPVIEKPLKTPTKPAATPKKTPAEKTVFTQQNLLSNLKELRQKANQKRSQNKENNLKKVMEFALEHNRITNDDVEKIAGVKDSQAQRYLNLLVKQRKLVRFGKASNTFYKPIK